MQCSSHWLINQDENWFGIGLVELFAKMALYYFTNGPGTSMGTLVDNYAYRNCNWTNRHRCFIPTMEQYQLEHLDELEAESIFVLREVAAQFDPPSY